MVLWNFVAQKSDIPQKIYIQMFWKCSPASKLGAIIGSAKKPKGTYKAHIRYSCLSLRLFYPLFAAYVAEKQP